MSSGKSNSGPHAFPAAGQVSHLPGTRLEHLPQSVHLDQQICVYLGLDLVCAEERIKFEKDSQGRRKKKELSKAVQHQSDINNRSLGGTTAMGQLPACSIFLCLTQLLESLFQNAATKHLLFHRYFCMCLCVLCTWMCVHVCMCAFMLM